MSGECHLVLGQAHSSQESLSHLFNTLRTLALGHHTGHLLEHPHKFPLSILRHRMTMVLILRAALTIILLPTTRYTPLLASDQR